MSELTPEIIRQAREEFYVRINSDGTLTLVFMEGGELAIGYEWIMEELCKRTLERTESRKP
jgi:hypothetical protein